MRNADKDLEMCNNASVEPWVVVNDYIEGPRIVNEDSYIMHGCLSDVIKSGASIDTKEEDLFFAAESREALPYWIKRAVEAEKLLRLLVVIDCMDYKGIMKSKINKFLGGGEG